MKTNLSQGEHVIKQGAANLQRGLETVGGKLYLTNERLIFEAHKINFQSNATEIGLEDIDSLAKSWTKFLGKLPIMPNSISVYTKENKEYRFVLFGRKAWIVAMSKNINNIKA